MGEYTCPHCQRPIYDDDALLCHFCGDSLRRPGPGWTGGMRRVPWKGLFVLLVLFIIVSFLMVVLR